MSKKKIDIDDRSLMEDDDSRYEEQLAEQGRLRREQEEAAARAQEDDLKRSKREQEKAREKKLAQERLELLQLKSGVISEDEATIKEEHQEAIKLTGWAWVANMWYHYKLLIIFIVFMAAALGFIIYSEVTRVRPDLTVMMIANNDLSNRTEELETFFEKYTDDLNGDGKVKVTVINMPMNPNNDAQVTNAYETKFIAQVQSGDAMIVISDSNTDEYFLNFFNTELSEDFPGNKYIDEQGFSFNSKVMAEELKFEYMPNDVHMSIRYPTETMTLKMEEAQANYDKSFTIFKRIVDDVTQRCLETNDPGLETEPIRYDESQTETSQTESE